MKEAFSFYGKILLWEFKNMFCHISDLCSFIVRDDLEWDVLTEMRNYLKLDGTIWNQTETGWNQLKSPRNWLEPPETIHDVTKTS